MSHDSRSYLTLPLLMAFSDPVQAEKGSGITTNDLTFDLLECWEEWRKRMGLNNY